MDLGLKGKVAMVTGGSKGIGRGIIDELGREGCKLVTCARGEKELKNVVKEVQEAYGASIIGIRCDVTKPQDLEMLVKEGHTKFGRIDVLVNNAGGAKLGRFDQLADTDWQEDIDVKLFSMIRTTRLVVPIMKQQGGGRIININAVQAYTVDPNFFATATNRASCIAFTKALAIELAPHNILVNSVNIGYVLSDQWRRIHMAKAPHLSQEEFVRMLAERDVPLRRFGRPDEVSALVAFLASEKASYVTGASIDVTGGMSRYL